jgi:hypothetical protein
MTQTVYSPSSNSGSWTNPQNAYSSNNVRAYTTTTALTNEYGDYGITGTDETIDTVEIGIERYTNVSGHTITLYYSVNGGSSWTYVTNTTPYLYETLDYYDRTSDRTWTWTLLNNTNFKTKIVSYVSSGCFKKGTQILTPNGLKNIEDLKIGEYVIGDENGRKVFTKIKARTIHFGTWMIHIYKDIEFAGNHKIWIDNQWKEVFEIQPNAREYKGIVYNIETELENFYSGDLLIHNLSKT